MWADTLWRHRPGSPIGRGHGLKHHQVWVRVPPGARRVDLAGSADGRINWHARPGGRSSRIHGAIYFAPEAREEYAALGIDDRMTGYFASRSAPMGAVPASVVIATFFNFDHGLVERSIDGVWDRVTPDGDPGGEAARRRPA